MAKSILWHTCCVCKVCCYSCCGVDSHCHSIIVQSDQMDTWKLHWQIKIKMYHKNSHFTVFGPWHKMTANILSVILSAYGKLLWNSTSQVKSFWLDFRSRFIDVKEGTICIYWMFLPIKAFISFVLCIIVFQYSIETCEKIIYQYWTSKLCKTQNVPLPKL